MESSSQDKKAPTQVLTPPAGADRMWQEKVQRAQTAREQAKRLRVGKPVSFRGAVGQRAV